MNITIKKKTVTEIPVRWLWVCVPIEDDDLEGDPLPGRSEEDGNWVAWINLKTGEWGPDPSEDAILDGVDTLLPVSGKTSIYAKVRDSGVYSFFNELYSEDGPICTIEGYVPEFFPDEHYGDYVILELDGNQITNWDTSDEAVCVDAEQESTDE